MGGQFTPSNGIVACVVRSTIQRVSRTVFNVAPVFLCRQASSLRHYSSEPAVSASGLSARRNDLKHFSAHNIGDRLKQKMPRASFPPARFEKLILIESRADSLF
jgi:hypothetical protein